MKYQWIMYKLHCRAKGLNEHDFTNLKQWIEGYEK